MRERKRKIRFVLAENQTKPASKNILIKTLVHMFYRVHSYNAIVIFIKYELQIMTCNYC